MQQSVEYYWQWGLQTAIEWLENRANELAQADDADNTVALRKHHRLVAAQLRLIPLPKQLRSVSNGQSTSAPNLDAVDLECNNEVVLDLADVAITSTSNSPDVEE